MSCYYISEMKTGIPSTLYFSRVIDTVLTLVMTVCENVTEGFSTRTPYQVKIGTNASEEFVSCLLTMQ